MWMELGGEDRHGVYRDGTEIIRSLIRPSVCLACGARAKWSWRQAGWIYRHPRDFFWHMAWSYHPEMESEQAA